MSIAVEEMTILDTEFGEGEAVMIADDVFSMELCPCGCGCSTDKVKFTNGDLMMAEVAVSRPPR